MQAQGHRLRADLIEFGHSLDHILSDHNPTGRWLGWGRARCIDRSGHGERYGMRYREWHDRPRSGGSCFDPQTSATDREGRHDSNGS